MKEKIGKICSNSMIKENIQPIRFAYCSINQKNIIVSTDADINALRDYLSQKKKLGKAGCSKTKVTFP
jgi:hypothetical protein